MIFLFVCMYVCTHVGVCACEYRSPSALGERHGIPLELEFKATVGRLIQMLGTELSEESLRFYVETFL